ncbi:MAG TPA: glycosyltransferase family 4 protein [Candidatus Baltobacteraceae bacterium]|nr:glycosyltransferase family 4 protein [Candidatus Baltobacteraceae bacterium]
MSRYPHLPGKAVILSFEGPDRYSLVGGLGVRVTELARALEQAGIETDLFFIGDPFKPGVENFTPRIRLRRWCQWISRFHPGGVYDGEPGKIADFTTSAPRFIVSELIEAAAEAGERTIVFAEDWQTAPAVIELDAQLRRAGLRQSAILTWNANNTYGFETIDWAALARAAQITAVSKYMKFELAQLDVPSLVIPNGIPPRLLQTDAAAIDVLRQALKSRNALLKVGRFDPDKRWLQAIDAVADLRGEGVPVQLIVRGGKEPYGNVVLSRMRERKLRIADLTLTESTPAQLAHALSAERADVINLRSFLPDETLYALYGAAAATLANSGKEPFGLVGLEVMASGGIPVCGSTGEDYAMPFENAIVCDTDDPRELATYLHRLFDEPQLAQVIREHATATARRYVWPAVLDILDLKIRYLTQTRG